MPDVQDPHADSFIGRTLCDGTYSIQRVLGHGGMGKVFLAIHTTLRIPFALKQGRADQPLPEQVVAEIDYILRGGGTTTGMHQQDSFQEQDFPGSGGEHTDRFVREALLLARLEHPSIPTLYDYFAEDGYWYLVIDFIPGPTLRAYLRQYAPLPALEAVNYAMQLCDVLDYLHQRVPPVIFRDLKPSNIILTLDGALILVDFGIARYFKAGQFNDTTAFGSPGYASPEQYVCESQTDTRSDLYSLGIILHEMLSGQRPQGTGGKIEPLHLLRPDISTALSGLVELATRQDPLYRFQSAHVFYQALERIYTIEERIAYQRSVARQKEDSTRSEEQPMTRQEKARATIDSSGGNVFYQPSETIPVVSTWTMNLDQRKQTRQRLQHERQTQQARTTFFEQQLSSIDESLKQRAQLPLSQTLQSPSQPAQKSHRYERGFPCALWIGFLLVMVILLVLASLLLYTNYVIPAAPSAGNQTPLPATPTAGITQDTHFWRGLPSLPSSEADNAATYVELGGRPYIYMSGGNRSQNNIPDYDRGLYRYDILAARWERVTPANFPGMINNAAVTDQQGDIFFTSGYAIDLHMTTSTLYEYQPASSTLHSINPPAQVVIGFGGSILVDKQDHLYITQGFTRAGRPGAQAGTGWYRYDIDTEQWHQLAPLPAGLGYTLLAADNHGSIFIFGGATDAGQQQPTDQAYRYDITRNSWNQVSGPLPHEISGASGCIIRSGELFLVGGYNAMPPTGPAEAWQVNLTTLKWQRLPAAPFDSAELGNAVCDGNGHVYIERGGNGMHHPTSDFWEFVDAAPLQ